MNPRHVGPQHWNPEHWNLEHWNPQRRPGPRGRQHHPGGPGPHPFDDGPQPFRGGPGGFGGFGRGGRGRRPRGDVRAAVLVLLAEGPSNGYRVIGEVERRSGGVWRPSPGSVYPTLQQLQDEGLVATDPADAKQFTLTDAGREHVEEHLAGAAPWEQAAQGVGGREVHEVMGQLRQLAVLLEQVARSGRPQDVRRASDALEAARKEFVAVLGEDPRSEALRG